MISIFLNDLLMDVNLMIFPNLCINKPHANMFPPNIAIPADIRTMVVSRSTFADVNNEHVCPLFASAEDVYTLYGDGSVMNADDTPIIIHRIK